MTAAQRAAFRRVFGHDCPLDEERDWLRDYGLSARGDAGVVGVHGGALPAVGVEVSGNAKSLILNARERALISQDVDCETVREAVFQSDLEVVSIWLGFALEKLAQDHLETVEAAQQEGILMGLKQASTMSDPGAGRVRIEERIRQMEAAE